MRLRYAASIGPPYAVIMWDEPNWRRGDEGSALARENKDSWEGDREYGSFLHNTYLLSSFYGSI